MGTRKYGDKTDPGEDTVVGRVLAGRYRIDGVLDEGGAAVVYRAVHVDLDRPVAVKLIQSVWASDDEVRGRFEREARALAALQHPHIVNLIDYGVDGRAPYLVMELLEGRSLRVLLDEHRTLPPERAFAILRQVLRALAFAHERGLLHRDLKPGNVFLQSLPDIEDHVKLLDFGLAKFVAASGRDGAPLTRAGTVSGTPAYMAPEQASGKTMDARTDVYAAGTLLFEMLSGQRPFEGGATDIMQQKLVMEAPSLGSAASGLQVRPELEQVFARSLAREPDGRFADLGEMLAALDAIPQPAVAPAAPAGVPAAGPAAPAHAAAGGAQPTSKGAGMPKALLAAIIGLPLLGAFGVCAVAGVLVLVSGSGEEASGAEPSSRTVELPEGLPLPQDEPEGAEGVDAPNPWTTDPVPDRLADIKSKVERGERVSGTELRELNHFARDNPDDVRPYLLTGHALVGRGAKSSAIGRYEHAWRMDPEARGDPRMLDNLVDMALGSSAERAGRSLERIYGEEALPALEDRKEQGELTGPQLRRLQSLRERLRS